MTCLYPLKLAPDLKEKVWGGRRLAAWGKALPEGALIGESWEAGDSSVVVNGPLAGRTVGELVNERGPAVHGSRAPVPGRFPLLVKLIDASQSLSVQVHPNDRLAQRLEGQPNGKTEAWYALDAAPDARIAQGFTSANLTPSQVEQAVRDNTLERRLRWVRLRPGEVSAVPAGTVHAIGAGMLIYEVQQNSDITYRLYDWGRQVPGRELDVEKSLESLRLGEQPPPRCAAMTLRGGGGRRTVLHANVYFALERLTPGPRHSVVQDGATPRIFTVLDGRLRAEWAGADASVDLARGDTLLLPATCPATTLVRDGVASLLSSYVPDLEFDVIAPLRAGGYSDARIARAVWTARP